MPFGGLLTLGIIGGATGLIGAGLQSSAAGNAADAQVAAANHAAQLQYQSGQNALNFQNQVFQQQQANLQPWLNSGANSLLNLDYLLGLQPSNFSPSPMQTTSGAPGANGQRTVPTGGNPLMPGLPTPGGKPLLQVSPRVTSTQAGPPGMSGGGTLKSLPPTAQFVGSDLGFGPPTSTFTGSGPSLTPGGVKQVQPGQLNTGLGGFGSLSQGWNTPFNAPTNVTEANDPGYQFRLSQGEKALQSGAAASGDLLSGGTQKALQRYGQDYASNEYQNVYNRALQQYQQQYNIFEQNQANKYNRLASLAGLGQTTAGELNSAGGQAAGNVGNILLNTGQQIGQDVQNAGAARASGYVGGANAFANSLGNIGNTAQQLYLLNMLNNPINNLAPGGFSGNGGA